MDPDPKHRGNHKIVRGKGIHKGRKEDRRKGRVPLVAAPD